MVKLIFLIVFIIFAVESIAFPNAETVDQIQLQDSLSDDPIVTLSHGGKLQGSIQSIKWFGKKYFSFKGIRYALPPVDELRFKAPKEYPSWEGVVSAKSHGGSCVQPGLVFGTKGVEDCLFLNVYTPNLTPEKPLPVMVWIHGGSFTIGSGDQFVYGPEYLLEHDVVLVTLNYRLGVLGFLSTNDSHAQGNYGAKDVVQSLKWIQANIGSFGGDPNRVTIFGESSGAALVHYLQLSDMGKGLFQAAISQSGVALNSWSLQENPSKNAFEFGKKLNLDAKNTEELIEKLRKINAEDIGKATPTITEFSPLMFAPAIEPHDSSEVRFLPEHPLKIMTKGVYNRVPFILGNTDVEGLYGIRQQTMNKDLLEQWNQNPNLLLPFDWHVAENSSAAEEIISEIRKEYFNGGDITDILEYVRFISDRDIDYSVYKTVAMHMAEQTEPVFYYVFSFDGVFNLPKKILLLGSYEGAMHADDLAYFWKMGKFSVPVLPTSATAITQKRLLKMWTDFAKTYNPTPEPDDLITVEWPSAQSDFEYLDIGNELVVKEAKLRTKMQMWADLDKKYGLKP